MVSDRELNSKSSKVMKKFKNIVVGIVALTMSTNALAQAVGDRFKVGNLYYKITSLTPATVDVASQYQFYPYWNDNEKPTGSIVIPSTVTYNDIAFDVTAIGTSAFEDCYRLRLVDIPESVTSIGYESFSGCNSLRSITIPTSVTSIGYLAFDGCSALTSITIPESVTSIKMGAFRNCRGLTSVNIHASITTIKNHTFCYCHNLTTVNIFTPITSIGECVFLDCRNLTSINFPESLTSIGIYAFYNCRSLTSITLPASVTSIGDYAFSMCNSLSAINVDTDNTSFCSEDGVLFNFNKTVIRAYPMGKLETSYTIPSTVNTISSSAFYSCSRLTSIIIPPSVTLIGNSAFKSCSGLTSITLPESLTSIGKSAFYECTGLTTIILPESLILIDSWAFAYCEGLESIYISESLEVIKVEAFLNCYKLTSITIPASVKIIDNNAFSHCDGLISITSNIAYPDSVGLGYSVFAGIPKGNVPNACALYVPEGSLSLYENAWQWKDFLPYIFTGIEDISQTNITVYPNPARDALNIKSNSPIHGFEIYDAIGRLVLSKTEIIDNENVINISSLTHGVYFIRFRTTSGTTEHKVIIED